MSHKTFRSSTFTWNISLSFKTLACDVAFGISRFRYMVQETSIDNLSSDLRLRSFFREEMPLEFAPENLAWKVLRGNNGRCMFTRVFVSSFMEVSIFRFRACA